MQVCFKISAVALIIVQCLIAPVRAAVGDDFTSIYSDDFETDQGIFAGTNKRFNEVSTLDGQWSLRLRKTSALRTGDWIDISAYSGLSLKFSFYGKDMDVGDSFNVATRFNGDASFAIVKEWASGTDFSNEAWIEKTVYIQIPSGKTQMKFEFRGNSNQRNDIVYIDSVMLSGSTLPVLFDIGNTLPPGGLFQCQSDCDNNSQCAGDLKCFKRDLGTKYVSGCAGDADLVDDGEEDFCVLQEALRFVGNNAGVPSGGLQLCDSDCDTDADCAGELKCFERNLGRKDVPGCTGDADSIGDGAEDFCVLPEILRHVANNANVPSGGLQLCDSDCDSDAECAVGLTCFQRDVGTGNVPGCIGDANLFNDKDFCVSIPGPDPTPSPPVPQPTVGSLSYISEISPNGGFLECQSDCDSDSDCATGLKCFQRRLGTPVVPGCVGDANTVNNGSKDFCIQEDVDALSYVRNGGTGYKLCQGDCDYDSDCDGDLICHQRDMGSWLVPGCQGDADQIEDGAVDFCILPPITDPPVTAAPSVSISPSVAPVPTPPTVPQCPNGDATYFPGDLTVTLGGGLATSTLLASTGLRGRVLTREGQPVSLNEGTSQSTASMHSNADGAATIGDDSNPSRYFLVSNQENGSGGVGILHFDATKTPHDVIGYRRTAENTPTGSRNCGGGRTPWGTWLTSEESGTGSVYEVDPNEAPGNDYCRSPIVPPEGGNYESNAFWPSTADNKYHFYTTDDASSNYRLTRFIPDDDIDTMLAKPRKLDRLCGASGTHSYLKMTCTADCSSSTPSGYFSWTTSRSTESGDQIYPNAEGIDVKGNELYFVTKGQKRLYILDLLSTTWTSTATIQSGGSSFSPDQVARITGSNSPDDLLYFAEDGSGTSDIHARGRDQNGDYKFFTIIRGYSTTETSGLTFSPDNKYMYFAHQSQSEIWQIWREDGCTFGNGVYLDVNYHDFVSRYLRY